jgi:hypothetical protein
MLRLAVLLGSVALVAAPSAFAGPYCLPTKDRDQIAKTGSVCPTRYFSTGRCCQALHADTPRAMPKIAGTACPAGWFASADSYCVSFR